jgi:hypothetical protein
MPRGTASALTVIRVPRGQPAPDKAQLRAAVARDRRGLRLAPETVERDVAVAGPYRISVDGHELDEYVVWEQ